MRLPSLAVLVRRSWATCAAPGKVTKSGASITLIVRVTLLPRLLSVDERAGTCAQGSALRPARSRGRLPLTVST